MTASKSALACVGLILLVAVAFSMRARHPGAAPMAGESQALGDPREVHDYAALRTPTRVSTPSVAVDASEVEAVSIPPKIQPRKEQIEDSRLGRFKWSFRRKAPTAERVLANDFFNPDHAILSDEARAGLDEKLTSIIRLESELEMGYLSTRQSYVLERLRDGQFEPHHAIDGKPSPQDAPRDPEEEVVFAGDTARGDCIIRIHWGESASLDGEREKILAFKSESIKEVTNYIAQCKSGSQK